MAQPNDESLNRAWNFGAGPAAIPVSVLREAQASMLDYAGSGMSVMELSHRSKEYETIHNAAIEDLRRLLDVPEEYAVLFVQGGGSTMFASVVYNLLGSGDKVVDYFVTGAWSEKAAQEAKLLGAQVNTVINTKSGKFRSITSKSEWTLSAPEKTAYAYYCMNETVHGVEWFETPEVDPSVPLVCDASSTILSRPIPIRRHALIYAGAQKNIGPSGVTVVIVRKDLLGARPFLHPVPLMLNFKTYADANSLYNTPPTWGIYVSGLVFKWLLGLGGLEGMEAINTRKASKLYAALDAYPKLFQAPVAGPVRSRMNVVWRVLGEDGQPSDELEKEFLKGAEARRMVQLKGHRSAGGIRASIYNAVPEEGVDALVAWVEEFAKKSRA
ncbi:putative phosphoserine aminotransferase [Gonapodya prolifera JEL478]|uniref:phosphoserine transaminase n=1 Tax=Gonapodya prolifera (strain JEL478) TaxID=1344416 RepID=A0A138ZZK1_GONPJ|nr:putative phosphoserine aminotransferase [Gonapodya prolifera JEL478]|eukprot:KXS09921.1 putative phosphoserine aminotransferase [Gonapodya prolifera JEL478]